MACVPIAFILISFLFSTNRSRHFIAHEDECNDIRRTTETLKLYICHNISKDM